MRQIAIVYNPNSGSDKINSKIIESLFHGSNLKISYYSISKDMKALNAELKTKKYSTVVAAGGDGTVNACVSLAAKHQVALGILPAGTLNHFAKDAKIPLDLKAAAKLIIAGNTMKIDYATASDNVFVNNATIGIYPQIVVKRERLQSKVGKWPAAFAVALSSLFSNTTHHLDIETPRGNFRYKTSMLFVGNNSYQFSKLGFTNRSELNAGQLFMYAIHDNHRLALITSAILAFFGIKRRERDRLLLTKGPIVVHSRKKHLKISLDGEVTTVSTPIRFNIHPAGIDLIAPN